jgi:hypothetical protein
MGNSPWSLYGSDANEFDPNQFSLGADMSSSPDLNSMGAADPSSVANNGQFSTGAQMKGAGTDALSGAGAGAMFGPWGAAAGAGLGLAKYFAFDKPANDRERTLAATTQKFSPWTGLQAQAPGQVNPMGSTMQGAAAGAGLGQNMSAANNNAQLQQAQIAYLNQQQQRGMQSYS